MKRYVGPTMFLLLLALLAGALRIHPLSVSADSYTVMLLHFDGTNNETHLYDYSGLNHVITATTAKVSTTQSKFGGTSVDFGGTGTVTTPDNANYEFGAGDFTIDFWIYLTVNSSGTIISKPPSGTLSPYLLQPQGTFRFSASSAGVTSDLCSGVSAGSADTNVWTHFAIVRSGTTITLYKNGTSQNTCSVSTSSLWDNTADLKLGPITGFMDEFRMSKGIARWTSNFTPPTDAYTGGVTFTKTVAAKQTVHVGGTLSKGSGTFAIDDPLDPKNKILFHSFVESPDVKNIYDGIVQLDKHGTAEVELPAYFVGLNKEYRYLVTPLEQAMPNLYIKSEVHKSFFGLFGTPVFYIGGGVPGGVVSWQVTGIRRDPYIEANPIQVEVPKGPDTLVAPGDYIFSGYKK